MKRFAKTIAVMPLSCLLFTMASCERGSVVIEQRSPPPPVYAPAPAVYPPAPAPAAYPPPAAAYTYEYYPDSEIYYEPTAQIYFWFDGGSWHHDHLLPRTFDVGRERHVSVRLNTNQPWTMHERVRAEHPGHADFRHARND